MKDTKKITVANRTAKMATRRIAIFLLTVTLLTANEPSLKETTDWLRDRLTESGYAARTSYKDGSASLRKVADKLLVDGCSISYRYRSDSENRSFILNASTVRVDYFWATVSLAAATQDVLVQEKTILGTKYFDVKINSSSGKLLGKYGMKTFISENGGPQRTINEDSGDAKAALFSFADESLAQRVAKALSHAVSLCGGSTEPF